MMDKLGGKLGKMGKSGNKFPNIFN